MAVRGPNARRDFHVDPSDEILYMLRGAMRLGYMEDGRRREQIIHEGELCLLPSPSSGSATGAIGSSTG